MNYYGIPWLDRFVHTPLEARALKLFEQRQSIEQRANAIEDALAMPIDANGGIAEAKAAKEQARQQAYQELADMKAQLVAQSQELESEYVAFKREQAYASDWQGMSKGLDSLDEYMADEQLTKALDAGDLDGAIELCKGAGHKYLKRIATGNPKRPYHYVYKVTSQHAAKSDPKVGDKVKVAVGDKQGHYEVTKRNGRKVTLKHDETGHEMTVTADKLHDMFTGEHEEAIDAAHKRLTRTHEAAQRFGSESQQKRAKALLDAHREKYDYGKGPLGEAKGSEIDSAIAKIGDSKVVPEVRPKQQGKTPGKPLEAAKKPVRGKPKAGAKKAATPKSPPPSGKSEGWPTNEQRPRIERYVRKDGAVVDAREYMNRQGNMVRQIRTWQPGNRKWSTARMVTDPRDERDFLKRTIGDASVYSAKWAKEEATQKSLGGLDSLRAYLTGDDAELMEKADMYKADDDKPGESLGETSTAELKATLGDIKARLAKQPGDEGLKTRHAAITAELKKRGGESMSKGLVDLGDYLRKSGVAMPVKDPGGLPTHAEAGFGRTKSAAIESGSAEGGELADVGMTSGSGDSTPAEGTDKDGQPKGAPKSAKAKFSEDDADEEKQMSDHKKPLEVEVTRKSLTPADQRQMVAREHAAKVAELTKSAPDVQMGGRPHPLSTNVVHGCTDQAAEALLKSEFYHGNAPTLAPVGSILRQSVLCKSDACGQRYTAALTACPHCGTDTVQSRMLPKSGYLGATGQSPVVLTKSNEPLLRRSKVAADIYFPGKE